MSLIQILFWLAWAKNVKSCNQLLMLESLETYLMCYLTMLIYVTIIRRDITVSIFRYRFSK